MSHRRTITNSPGSILRAILLTFLFIIIFLVTLIIALFLLVGPDVELSQIVPLGTSSPRPNPTPTLTVEPLVTPIAASMTNFRNVALGFAVDYPADWQKRETTLRTILSPDATGLYPENLQGTAIWVGIPADDTYEPEDLLTDLLADFPASTEILETGTLNIGSQPWTSVQIEFEDEELGQTGRAMLAATNNSVREIVIDRSAYMAESGHLEETKIAVAALINRTPVGDAVAEFARIWAFFVASPKSGDFGYNQDALVFSNQSMHGVSKRDVIC